MVISVIALLMAVLLPALQRARSQARKVMCQSNLRQFGSVLLMYVEDNEGRIPLGMGRALWLLRGSSQGEQHHQDPNVPEVSQSVRMARAALCPMAVKAANNNIDTFSTARDNGNIIWQLEGSVGSTFRAWTITSPGPVFHASYGFNFWPFGMSAFGHGGFFPRPPHGPPGRSGLNVFSVASRSKVPILLDSMWAGFWPSAGSIPPPESRGSTLMPYCINRHNGRVNGLFLDWSLREVGLKELWTLKWSPNFDTAGPWTQAGGVQREEWPEWMRGFKDY